MKCVIIIYSLTTAAACYLKFPFEMSCPDKNRLIAYHVYNFTAKYGLQRNENFSIKQIPFKVVVK